MFHINYNSSLLVIRSINILLVTKDRWREIVAVTARTMPDS